MRSRRTTKPGRALRLAVASAGATALVGAALCTLGSRSARGAEAANAARAAGGAVFEDGKFHNLIRGQSPMMRDGMLKTLRDFALDRSAVREPTAPLPVQPRRGAELAAPPESGLRVTWLGHSTALIELDGQRLLTDPMWSQRSSPVGFAGPRRFFAPPLPLEELPPLDAVIISHDHYDHLDRATVEALRPRVPLFVVPLEVGRHLRAWGVPDDAIRELDWWQETRVGALRLVCAPARHFSGRGLLDRNTTLWASWALLGPAHRVYFGGDGGMSPSFAEIGARLGPFDVTLLEIGAYNAAWADLHAGPEQAVQAHLDLRGELMLPIHWATFNLAMHGWTEPAERLLVAAAQRGVHVAVPRPGESVEPSQAPAPVRWWPALPWQSADEAPVISPGLEPVGSSEPAPPVAEAG